MGEEYDTGDLERALEKLIALVVLAHEKILTIEKRVAGLEEREFNYVTKED